MTFKACINCTTRKVGCHSACKSYLENRAVIAEKAEARRKFLAAENDFVGCKARTAEAIKKRRLR